MNYSTHYQRLIAKAQGRSKKDGVFEKHHILPVCLGGTDDALNLVLLTPEEHYVAHQLLVKMHPGVKGLTYAVVVMTGNPHGLRCNKLYGWLRRAHVAAVKADGRWRRTVFGPLSEDHKLKQSVALTGKPKSEQAKANMKVAQSNASPEHKAARLAKAWETRRKKGNAGWAKPKVAGPGKGNVSPEARAKAVATRKSKATWQNPESYKAMWETRRKQSTG